MARRLLKHRATFLVFRPESVRLWVLVIEFLLLELLLLQMVLLFLLPLLSLAVLVALVVFLGMMLVPIIKVAAGFVILTSRIILSCMSIVLLLTSGRFVNRSVAPAEVVLYIPLSLFVVLVAFVLLLSVGIS